VHDSTAEARTATLACQSEEAQWRMARLTHHQVAKYVSIKIYTICIHTPPKVTKENMMSLLGKRLNILVER
jgi:hypothetical protein